MEAMPRRRNWLSCDSPRAGQLVRASNSSESNEDASWSVTSPRVQLLIVLVLICIANQGTRALPFYLVDFAEGASASTAMNMDVGFSSSQYGGFATLAFSVPFTLASLVAGVLSDNSDRLRFLGLSGLGWSVLTASMASSASFQMLVLQRGLLGLSQAITNPASFSLLAERFPEARATANSIFSLGIYVGGGVASLGAALDEQVGWRNTCLIFGLVSAAFSMLAFTQSDPRRRQLEEAAESSPGLESSPPPVLEQLAETVTAAPSNASEVFQNSLKAIDSSSTRLILLASVIRFCAGFAILVWLPTAVRSNFPEDVERFAYYNSAIKAVAGGTASLAGGLAADALRAQGFGDRSAAFFCAATSLAAAPLWYFTLAEGLSFESSMGFLLAEYLVAETWIGPAIAALQNSVPADRRGAAQGVFSSLTAFGKE